MMPTIPSTGDNVSHVLGSVRGAVVVAYARGAPVLLDGSAEERLERGEVTLEREAEGSRARASGARLTIGTWNNYAPW